MVQKQTWILKEPSVTGSSVALMLLLLNKRKPSEKTPCRLLELLPLTFLSF